ncbi:MAG TPA: hypothetical protein VGQ99_23340 [Tepidisphaeraceae bacterium]|nr:hypothetical protein [Tepidisphaeraceae bacterium]
MLAILRKNNKKIMAVIGVFLMIAFVADYRLKGRTGGRGGSDVIGRIDGETVHGIEYENARAEWEMLTKGLRIPQMIRGFDGRPQTEFFSFAELPLIQRFTVAMPQQPIVAIMAARRVTSQIEATTYLLLLREANKMDIHPGRDAVQEALTSLQAFPGGDPVLRDQAVTNWLTIMAAFDRVAAAPKVTPAQSLRLLAQRQQEISLQLVEFRAEQFMRDIPEPTRPQLEEFFNKYRNDDPDTSESGFGYRYPNRVRVQYMRVPKEKLKATVTLEDMYGYFRNNPEKFEAEPTTQPTTGPTTRTALGPDLPSTRPTTAPTTQELAKLPLAQRWQRLSDKARERVKDEISQQLTEQMANALRQRFAADWPNFHMAARASNTTIPSDPPTTALGVPYHTISYLIRLREQVQRLKESRGVMPETAEEGQLLSQRQLADLPGIGQAFSFEGYRRLPFAELAVERAEPFLGEDEHKQLMENRQQTMALFQASPPLHDNFGNVYIFRIIQADYSHPPQSLDEIETKVRNDWRTNEALKKAKDAARLLVDSAKIRGGLQQALNAANSQTKLITTSYFQEGEPAIEGYKLGNEAATTRFTRDAFQLLSERLRGNIEHPTAVLEAPQAGVVIAAQLENAKPTIKDPLLDMRIAYQQQYIEHQRQAQILLHWLTPKNVEKRVNYVPEHRDEKKAPSDPLSVPPPNPLTGV